MHISLKWGSFEAHIFYVSANSTNSLLFEKFTTIFQ